MDYEYKYKKYKKKFKSLNGGFINLDKLNMFLAPSGKKEKLKNDIKKKEKEIEERKKEIKKIDIKENEVDKNKKEYDNINTDKILEELKELKLYVKSTEEEKEIIKKLNTKEIRNKMSKEIDNIAENIESNKITIEKGKENTVNLLENVVDDVKSKAKYIIEDLNEKKPKDPLYTVVNCNNKVSLPNTQKIPYFVPIKIPYRQRVYYLPQRENYIVRKRYHNIPYDFHKLSNINHKNLKPLELNSLYNTKQEELSNIKSLESNNLYNTKQEELNNIKSLQIIDNTDQKDIESLEINNLNNLPVNKNEEQVNEDKKLNKLEIINNDKKSDNLEIVNKKFDFSKIYKNTYLFAMVLILANFI